MSIFGLGIDIEEVSRFKEKKYQKNEKFYKNIFTLDEINYCLKKDDPYPHFTGKFCAKEAFIKATGDTKVKLSDIEISNVNGQPRLKFKTNLEIMLSISHTSKYATAIVVIEKK